MKRYFCTVIFLFVLTPWSWSQNSDTSWVGHFSYLNIKEVVSGDAKFYAASETAIFSYDPFSRELNTITTVNGLSGELISTIHYSNQYGRLLIGYENGLIEVYKEQDGEIITVVDIINKQNRVKITRGKKVRVSGFKKAIITLKKGQSIDLTTGI